MMTGAVVGLILFRHLLGPGFFYLLFYKSSDRFRQWKIQDKYPSKERIRFDVKQSFLSTINDVLILGLVIMMPLTFFENGISDFTFMDGVMFVVLFFLQDLYFYLTHVMFHHPLVYRYIHKVHHQSTNPTPWTSFSHHFVEGFVELLFYPLILLWMPVKVEMLLAYIFLTTTINFLGHCGFEFPWLAMSRLPGCPWVATYTFHNRHHQYFQGNYSLYFNIWDRFFKTQIEK